MTTPADVGLFGPDTVTWRIHADPSMLVGGLRALLIQALHPLAMAGVDQHSDYRDDPWGRLRRTSQYVVTTTFADTATAERLAAVVRAVHARVAGVDPVTGAAYRADDPELLAWVHNVEVHSFLTAYRHVGPGLTDADADRYVGEMVRAATLVGLGADDVPQDLDGLRAYLRGVDRLVVSDAARAAARTVLAPPMPLPLRPLWGIVGAAAVSLLPRRVRDLYGMGWSRPVDPAVRVAVFGALRTLNVVLPPPPPVRDARARARGAPTDAVSTAA